ncbi:ALP1-like protein isoform X1 [Tanacetum coccineum]
MAMLLNAFEIFLRGLSTLLGSIDLLPPLPLSTSTSQLKYNYVKAGRSRGKLTNLWIWNVFFDVVGSNNDINVLYQSPLFNDLKTGRAPTPEIPFVANGVPYPWRYYLLDGIYSELATLVKTIPEPDDDHKGISYKLKQESARKDVEQHLVF